VEDDLFILAVTLSIVRHNIYKEEELRRNNRLSLMLNSREAKALGVYCSRYRIKNKSEFLRNTIMKEIIRRFEEEYPSLWEDTERTLFNQKHI
jgi:hypothetical protein